MRRKSQNKRLVVNRRERLSWNRASGAAVPQPQRSPTKIFLRARRSREAVWRRGVPCRAGCVLRLARRSTDICTRGDGPEDCGILSDSRMIRRLSRSQFPRENKSAHPTGWAWLFRLSSWHSLVGFVGVGCRRPDGLCVRFIFVRGYLASCRHRIRQA